MAGPLTAAAVAALLCASCSSSLPPAGSPPSRARLLASVAVRGRHVRINGAGAVQAQLFGVTAWLALPGRLNLGEAQSSP